MVSFEVVVLISSQSDLSQRQKIKTYTNRKDKKRKGLYLYLICLLYFVLLQYFRCPESQIFRALLRHTSFSVL